MSRFSTFPFILEHAISISISDLKKWNYLRKGAINSGVLNWMQGGSERGRVSIKVDMDAKICHIILDYTYNETGFTERILLKGVESNLGAGNIWYFVCPRTQKLCRKLYFKRGYFISRFAILDHYYKNQTKSHRDRKFDKHLQIALQAENLVTDLEAKHFKRYYAGVPTKRYLKIIQKVRESERVGFPDVLGYINGTKM
ncbi:MAG: hypothetical protein IPM92_11035 [Saprospiraceae bacterium]|nr:hypothetical protein [Saprospiraceae bacterium]